MIFVFVLVAVVISRADVSWSFLSFVFVENVLLRRQTVITKVISISSHLVILRLSYELLILLQSVLRGPEKE